MTPSWISRIGLALIFSTIALIGTQLPSSAALAQSAPSGEIDFESPSLGTDPSKIIDPYTASGVTFSAVPGSFGDEVVGLTTNAHTTMCVPEPSSNQLLGTGRQSLGDGTIGREGSPIKATFNSPLAGPVEVSVDFQSLANVDVRLRLFDASGNEVGFSTATAQPGSGSCFGGDDRARTSLTASSSASVASVVMDVIGNSVLVIDDFSFAGGTVDPPGPINLSVNDPEIDELSVSVNGAVVVDNATITRISWDWGDGKSNDSFFPATHTYARAGTYEIVVTAFDDQGRSAEARKTVTVAVLAPTITSNLATTVPRLDGNIGIGEWDTGNKIELGNGFLTVKNDGRRLYVLLDMTGDTGDDTLATDFFDLTFDVNGDGQITPNVDLNYTLSADNSDMRYQHYLSAGAWTGLKDSTRSARAQGFGCFIADGTFTIDLFGSKGVTCTNHRFWEIAIDLSEIGARPGDTVRMGVRVKSLSPTFTNVVPTNMTQDFSHLIEVTLADALVPVASLFTGVSFDGSGALEITQAIQNRANSLPLVQDKDTVVRVYAEAINFLPILGSGTRQPVTVFLYGTRGGEDLLGSPLTVEFDAPSNGDREEISDTANFALPDTWNQGTVTFHAVVRRSSFLTALVTSGTVTRTFTPKETPTYWYVPLNVGTAGNPSQATNTFINNSLSYLKAIYPVSDVDFVARPWQDIGTVNASTADVIALLNNYYGSAVLAWVLGAIFTGTSPFDLPDQIHGFLPSGGGLSNPTWSTAGNLGRVSWGGPNGSSREGVMAHEIDHNLDMAALNAGTWGRHVGNPNCNHSNSTTTNPPPGAPAGCNWHNHGGSPNVFRLHDSNWGCAATGPDPNFPGNANSTDAIQEVGFDTRQPWANGTGIRDTVIPAFFPDLMSYCQSEDETGQPNGQLPTKWIAGYRWQNLFNSFSTVSSASAQADEVTALVSHIGDTYYVTGQINIDGTGSLDPVLVQPGLPRDVDTTSREYSVEVLDASGDPLLTANFDVSFVDEEGEEVDVVPFVFHLAAQPNVARIVLKRGTTVLDERIVSTNSPTITIVSPQTGEQWSGANAIAWDGDDLDGDDLDFRILYSANGGQTWSPVASNVDDPLTTTTRYTRDIDASNLEPSANAIFRIIGTDGFNTVTADSSVFTVNPEPPSVSIITPSQILTTNTLNAQAIVLSGAGGRPVDYLWTITPTGGTETAIGIGQSVQASLAAGTYTLAVTATNFTGIEGTDSVLVEVIEPTAPVIVYPATTQTASLDDEVLVEIRIRDANDVAGVLFSAEYDPRVFTPDAGYGFVLPDVGFQCEVEFNAGDPDRPVVLGALVCTEGQTAPDLLLGTIKFHVNSDAPGGPTVLRMFDTEVGTAGLQLVPSVGDSAILDIVGLVCGDQNFDQVVDIRDAIIDLQIVVGLVDATPLQQVLSDVVRDGQINVLDVILILQHIVGQAQIDGCGPIVNSTT